MNGRFFCAPGLPADLGLRVQAYLERVGFYHEGAPSQAVRELDSEQGEGRSAAEAVDGAGLLRAAAARRRTGSADRAGAAPLVQEKIEVLADFIRCGWLFTRSPSPAKPARSWPPYRHSTSHPAGRVGATAALEQFEVAPD